MSDRLKDEHFIKLSRLMQSHTGICLPPGKRLMIEGRLRKRVQALGAGSLAAYGKLLFDDGKLDAEFGALIDCVTTNKTDFFREPDHFTFLCEQAVPALLAIERASADLKIWSAASSMGAEAYTAAMVLADLKTRLPRLGFSILGTDISNEIIEQARSAIYPLQMIEPIPDRFCKRYIMRAVDRNRQEVRIVPELRNLVRFEQLNLMDESYPFDHDVDVIFCRNILIYFSKPTQQSVLGRLCSHLRPGGYLILGHSEAFALDDRSAMRQIAPSIFQKSRIVATRGRAA